MLPALTALFIACCVTHFGVQNSYRQFSFTIETTLVSFVILCELCDRILFGLEGSRRAQWATKTITHLIKISEFIFPVVI